MGFKTDNKPNQDILNYWNADGSRAGNGQGNAQSAVDPWGNLAVAAGGAKPPPDSPEFTDAVVRQRRASEMNRLMLGVGRSSTFSQGGMGSLNLGTTKLGGQ
jgi:hypothetical protein